MFKNKLPISSLISIAVISIGTFFTLIFASLYARKGIIEYQDYLILILGLSLFATGIAILLKKRWIRTILAISIFGLMPFLIYTFVINNNGPDMIFISVAYLSLAIGLPLFFILLLYNDKVSLEFGDKHIDEEFEDVLDHFE